MKTKVILCIVTVLLLMTLISMPSVGAEDFESGFDGWEVFTTYGASVQRSTAYAHSGSYSVEQWSYCSDPSDPGYTGNIIGAIRHPVTSDQDQYELSAWVYVTERTFAMASSFFGFVFDHWDIRGDPDVYVGWDEWGLDGSYLFVRAGYGWRPYVPYGLTLDVWHHVRIMADTTLGTVSLWLDEQLIVDNYPSFDAGEKPIYYYIDSQANWWVWYLQTHHYIDDVSTSEPSPAVGGEWAPLDRLQVLAPWLSSALLMLGIVASFVFIRRKRKHDQVHFTFFLSLTCCQRLDE